MKCFLSLAKTKKLSETAVAMGINLSTLSKYIDSMENELSVSLFTKRLSRQELTREGELIHPSIEYMVKQYDDQEAMLRQYTSRYESSIRVVIEYHQIEIMRRLFAFSKEYPKIKLEVTEASVVRVREMLDSGAADVGIVYEQFVDKKYPLTIPLRTDRLVAVVPEKHHLAKRGTISVSELQDEEFFLYRDDFLTYQYLLNICIAAGFAPKVKHSDLRMSGILYNVAAGNGVSFMAENIVDIINVPGKVNLRLSEDPVLLLCAAFNSDYPSKAIDMLMRFLLPKGFGRSMLFKDLYKTLLDSDLI